MCVPCAAGERWFAVKSSPCLGCLLPGRDNFLPARAKWSEMGVFRRAGRVLSRFGLEVGVAGRVLYRRVPVRGCQCSTRWVYVRRLTLEVAVWAACPCHHLSGLRAH